MFNPLSKTITLFWVLLLNLVQAHGGHVEAEQLSLVKVADGYVLQARVSYNENEATAINSVVISGVPAILQKRSATGYSKVKNIPIPKGQTVLAASSTYRIWFTKLPTAKTLNATFLLRGGVISGAIKNPRE